MDIETYLRANAEGLQDPHHPSRACGLHDVTLTEVDRTCLEFIRKAASAHGWLQSDVRRALPSADPRREVLRLAGEHADACVASFAHQLKESDPFLLRPDSLDFGPQGASAPEGWVALGLSALSLELTLAHAGEIGREPFSRFHWPLSAMGAGFGNERRYALAEAGRLAEGAGDPRVTAAIAGFVPPGEVAWGGAFIDEALAAVAGRLKSRKEILKSAVTALREAPGLPHDTWRYLDPHLVRHAKRFKIGIAKRLAIRAALKLI